MFITHCRDCAFAVFANNKQIGCQYDRIEKFKNLGMEVKEVTENDLTYYSINTFCNHCVNKDVWEKTENRETALYNFTAIKNTFIFIDEQNSDFSQTYNKLLSSCHSAIFADIRPKNILYILTNATRFNSKENESLLDLMRSILKDTGIEFSISYPLEGDTWNEYLYQIKGKIKTDYFSVFESGEKISPYFNTHLNNILNIDVISFIVVSAEKSGWTINRKFLEIFGWHNPVFCGQAILDEVESNEYQSELVKKLVINGKDIDFYAKPTISDHRNS